MDRPLFTRFPALKEGLPYAALGDLPTPVQRMRGLEYALGADAPTLFMKRDDLSSPLYGGNKVRKLEFVLARARQAGYSSVLTFGAAGSNHALATALFARQLGLGCISVLVPQPNAMYVRSNLLMHFKAGAELRHYGGMPGAAVGSIAALLRHWRRTKRFPYLIPPGGSSPLGVLGFVNAGVELREQVAAGLMPEPDLIYVASGTMGTAVGLALGLRAAGLRSQVMAVRVTDALFTSIRRARRLFNAANRLLCQAAPDFPQCAFPLDSFQFRHEFFGKAYAFYTEEGMRAVRLLRETEDLAIEGTYTGKTLAALLADADSRKLRGKTVLFWNTYNARDFSADIAGMDYHTLPPAFHRYFEDAVQPLDHP